MKLKQFKADLVPKKARNLDVFAKKKVFNEVLAGEWISNLKRRGIEFSGYRVYTPNDDASLIDWKASLRGNKTLVKELEVERAHNIFFLVDVSDSMLFASTEKLKCEYAAEVVSTIAYAVLRASDNVGMAMFNDHLVEKIYPQVGKRQYYTIIKKLSNPELYGGKFDLEKAIKYSMSFLRMRSTIIIISDFIGLKENWSKYMEYMQIHYNVVVIMIRDPIDDELPKDAGQVIIEDVYTGEKMYIDSKDYSERYNKAAKENKEEIKQKLDNIGIPFLELKTNEDYVEKLITFFRREGKRWV